MSRPCARWETFVFLLVLLAGCANQASVVELEDYTLKLERHQVELQRRIEQLEGRSRSPVAQIKSQQMLSAGLVAQLSDIEADVRVFTGRVTEMEHRMSLIGKKLDTETFRSEELLQRIDQLERQLAGSQQGNSKPKPNNPDQKSSAFNRPPSNQSASLSPSEAYNLAYNDYLKGNYSMAISAFDTFVKHYPTSVLVPQALFWTGESYYHEKSYWSAIKRFKQMVESYPDSEKISNALLKVGFSYLALDRKDQAKDFLQQVSRRFPNSNEAALAENKLASLD